MHFMNVIIHTCRYKITHGKTSSNIDDNTNTQFWLYVFNILLTSEVLKK